jgi:hypothetical protein
LPLAALAGRDRHSRNSGWLLAALQLAVEVEVEVVLEP